MENETPTKVVVVYKAVSPNGEVLYVGSSIDVERRLNEHKGACLWDRPPNKIEIIRCENRSAALKLERELIENEKPKFNVQGKHHKQQAIKAQVCFKATLRDRTNFMYACESHGLNPWGVLREAMKMATAMIERGEW